MVILLSCSCSSGKPPFPGVSTRLSHDLVEGIGIIKFGTVELRFILEQQLFARKRKKTVPILFVTLVSIALGEIRNSVWCPESSRGIRRPYSLIIPSTLPHAYDSDMSECVSCNFLLSTGRSGRIYVCSRLEEKNRRATDVFTRSKGRYNFISSYFHGWR